MMKMQKGSSAYNGEYIQLALENSDIGQCVECGHPINRGFCCGHCGSGNGTSDYGDYYEPAYRPLKNQ